MVTKLAFFQDAPEFFPVAPRGRLGHGDATQVELVARMRSQRASWEAVARALGRPVHDTRSAFDPTYVPDPMLVREPPEPKPARPSEVVTFGRGRESAQKSSVLVKADTRESRIVSVLVEGSPLATSEVAVRCGWTYRNAESALYALLVKDVVGLGAAGWRLTDAGWAEASRLAKVAS